MAAMLGDWAGSPGRAVLFDFNGTLSNDEPVLCRLFAEMFFEHLSWTMSEADYYERLAGMSDREIIEGAVAEHAPGQSGLVERLLAERRDRYLDLVREGSPIEAGTAALVELLAAHGVPLGIVTGAQRLDVDFVLEHRGLAHHFGAIVTEEDVAKGKPDPEGFERAAGLLGIEPRDALVFEDSIFGLRAASAAGMRTAALVGTKTASELEGEADLVLEALGPELLSGLLEFEVAP